MAEAREISAIVLAAGRSSRMGDNKLLLPWNGSTVIRHVVELVTSLGFVEVLVVTGHEADKVEAALKPLPVRLIHNPRYAKGMSTSIAAGVAAANADSRGYLLCLGDMPWVSKQTIALVVEELKCPTCAVVPRHGERWGNPVVFGRAFRSDLQDLKGDSGARRLLESYTGSTKFIELADERELDDLDTPEDYRFGSGYERGVKA